MVVKVVSSVLVLTSAIFSSMSHAKSGDQILLDAFHEYGITKCDSFILEKSPLNGKPNWNFFISKHGGGIDGTATEVSVIQIYGSKDDTVKIDYSYIQTNKACFVHSRSTITYPGTCSSNVDGNYWYVTRKMPNKDYVTYTNSGGIEMQAKEISVGNFKACIQETSIRNQGAHG